ncbi:MAG TPA: CotH kinase family protein [Bacteroidales bacterium]|nr:CotH kinase family protein [Bacteroidales bacterium]HPE54808.1 CotH kinase family protein [Bacteroidales bacterium]HRX96327.1 CotH kinase family protein [Bacteroidales bacterium]
MKKYFALVIVILSFSIVSFSQEFYNVNNINTIELEFSEQNWDEILQNLYQSGEDRLTGTAIINGEVFDSVGVRYKGNSTYQTNITKKPLNIKLDYIIGDQELEGFGTLKLSNGFKDPSMVREVLSYEIAREFMPASLANYAKVYINGTYLGLYTCVQDVDRKFMQSHLLVDDNTRVKGEMNGMVNGVWTWQGSDSSLYVNQYQLESDDGWSDLIDFLDTLNNYNEHLGSVLNVDRLLWMLAFDNLLVSLDAPINMPQNYYLFEDRDGRLNPIVWDLNETFGVFVNAGTGPPLNTYGLQHFSHLYRINDSGYPIVSKVLNDDVRLRTYVAHMKTMMTTLFENGWYEDRALEIQQIIDEEVQNDPNKLYTYDEFIDNVYTSIGSGPPPQGQSIIGLVELMETRLDFLSGLAMFAAEAPAISSVIHEPGLATTGTEVWITASISNTGYVQLGYRDQPAGKFIRTDMFDDGMHNDGAAGDGTWGISLIAGNSNIEYYIFADNGDAVTLSPEKAEYEYYSIEVTGDLVINEFMADNETTVADQDGEYDDWIELYNNSASDIDLSGWYLSDNAANPGKWTFPDTLIQGGGYLIIWADEDGSQDGLHANFKLSADGEVILLSDASLNLIDEVTFGAQKADTTTGRYPNGTGDFIEMLPSFGAENTDLIDAVDIPLAQPDGIQLYQNYPNPFREQTTILVVLAQPERVSLEVFDLAGRKVEIIFRGDLPEGDHEFLFEANNVEPGIYFSRLTSAGQVKLIKMVVGK